MLRARAKLSIVTVEMGSASSMRDAEREQAVYFRAEIEAERQILLANLGKRPPLIDRPAGADRAPLSLTETEGHIRHLDWLIARLDSRFGLIESAPV